MIGVYQGSSVAKTSLTLGLVFLEYTSAYFLMPALSKRPVPRSPKDVAGSASKGPSGEIGRRNRLKIYRPHGHVGSSPTSGTNISLKKT